MQNGECQKDKMKLSRQMEFAAGNPEGIVENSPTFQGWVNAVARFLSPEGTADAKANAKCRMANARKIK